MISTEECPIHEHINQDSEIYYCSWQNTEIKRFLFLFQEMMELEARRNAIKVKAACKCLPPLFSQ